MRVLISGAGGNLGSKLTEHLKTADWCSEVIAIDVRPIEGGGKVTAIVADLRDAADRRWLDGVERADAVIHFAAQNAAPGSSWLEATQSFDMTANLLEHAGRREQCRFFFASSNHAMGGYKDVAAPGGKISGATPALTGTRVFDGTEYRTSNAYGASKILGERAVVARAKGTGGRLTGVIARIGWAQRGENLPSTLRANGGMPREGVAPPADEAERDMRWFRNMWLSNRDFTQMMERAILADAAEWPEPAIVIAGISNNAGTPWDLETGRRYLGYAPADDVWSAVG